ncbi:hypothetical protein ODJ79_12405 [Actinoplanes sp. KI2]|uniref:hypothetical protein n=1 Tax=Actinoplanes sp. KI2 TaxID=2983315 RepID=UPI0021D5B761|nr:hypothetical protein [Actinoplanes sp. KI2]MCU7724520.1 hypothetical protein [Actinoplanes sp. KI2]
MRIPTFSRQTEPETTDAERPTAATAAASTDTRTAPVRPRDDEPTTRDLRTTPKADDLPPAPARSDRTVPPPPPPSTVSRPVFPKSDETTETPVVAGPKPRASLLATLGLILGVASVLLVLSGPLLGWGIGVAGVALVLSLSGIRATGKRHVAGKSDALLGMVLALGAIVLGVLALTGSLTWLGTNTDTVPAFRQWLDTHTVNHF